MKGLQKIKVMAMADKRIKVYWSREMDALLKTYKQFQLLIPSEKNAGAAHAGEDGRYVEYLIREYLKRYLPKDLEVLTGFILRPAVVCGNRDKSRKKDEHEVSGQLDIIVYDTSHYPVYQRFGESVIVPPEGVVAIISVKKHLRISDVKHEIQMLERASSLCLRTNGYGKKARSPFTALITMEDKIGEGAKIKPTTEKKGKKAYKVMESYYGEKKPLFYDEMVDFVGSLSEWGLYKERPSEKKETSYFFYEYSGEEKFLGFQLILQNILSVYYSNTSQLLVRPGFTDNSGEGYIHKWGMIKYHNKEIVRK